MAVQELINTAKPDTPTQPFSELYESLLLYILFDFRIWSKCEKSVTKVGMCSDLLQWRNVSHSVLLALLDLVNIFFYIQTCLCHFFCFSSQECLLIILDGHILISVPWILTLCFGRPLFIIISLLSPSLDVGGYY